MSEHPFDRMKDTGQPYHDRIAQRAAAAFEEGKVRYLLSVLKFNGRKAAAALQAANEQQTGRPELTFRAFNAAYMSFPLLLGASQLGGAQLHLDPAAMIPALFKTFGQAAFVAAYDTFYSAAESQANGRTVALVFPRKGFKNGMVIYLADDLDVLPFGEREAFFAYAGGTKARRHWLLVRSFQQTLEAVYNRGHGWRPPGEI